MKNLLTARHVAVWAWSLATIVAVLLACSISESHAAATKVVENATRTPGAPPRQVLPALSNPRPVRQSQVVICNGSSAEFGSNICIIVFDQVPAGRVLQIDKMVCLGTTSGGGVIFNTHIKDDAAHLIGAVFPKFSGSGFGEASGPYYFKAGETPKFAGNAGSPTAEGTCMMTGMLWQAN
jgi:hypothetical protein